MTTTSTTAASALLVLAVLVGSPAAATAEAPSRSTSRAAASPSSATQPGVDVAAVDKFVADQIEAAHIPGAAIAITHGRHVVHVAGFGHDSTGAAVTGQTPFRVASLSKSITAGRHAARRRRPSAPRRPACRAPA